MILAAGTAEGRIVVIARDASDKWDSSNDFSAHAESVNGISWGPPTLPALLSQANTEKAEKFTPPNKRLVSCGSDNKVRIWELIDKVAPQPIELGSHDDWVRDVAWCNNIGLKYEMIASVSEDKTCRVWKNNGAKGKQWTYTEKRFGENVPLWKTSWSQVGNLLAVSGGDN